MLIALSHGQFGLMCRPASRRCLATKGISSSTYGSACVRAFIRPQPYESFRHVRVQAADGNGQQAVTYDLEDIDTAKIAIDLGQALCREDRWSEALAIFEKALTLPGTGLKRFRDKPRTISDGEKMAALFNIACCHSRMNDVRSGLVALAGCFEAGYEDFQQARTDPDLENLRSDERFEALLVRFEPKKRTGLFGLF